MCPPKQGCPSPKRGGWTIRNDGASTPGWAVGKVTPAPAPIDAAAVEDVYDGYGAWKDWSARNFMRVTAQQRAYFADELRGTPLAGRDVLEIGFGSGAFLAWAKDQCATLYGTEAMPAARDQARAAGVTILPLDLAQALPHHPARFAAIVAFDVMEHLTIAENQTLLDQVAVLLADHGLYVARFPNGQSPLGRVHQYGDMTHRSVLSAGIMSQLVAGRPFDVVHLGNQAPSRAAGLRRMGSMARNLAQWLVETAVAKLYGMSAPLGPNSVAVLRRRPRGMA